MIDVNISLGPDNKELLSEEMLESYYSSDPVSEGGLLAHGWSVDTESCGFFRRLGGKGTPFVTCDLSIERLHGAWVPHHDGVAMNPEATPSQAANALMDYWRSLPLRDRLSQTAAENAFCANNQRYCANAGSCARARV